MSYLIDGFIISNDGNRYLLEKHTFAYLPSASVLPYLSKKNKANANLLAFAVSSGLQGNTALPHVDDEISAIKDAFPNTSVVLNASATEETFKRQSPQFDILHLATHGYYDDDSPLDSYIRFYPSNKSEDGRLTTRELYGLKLSASLAVLSACETGRGHYYSGDEIIGLTRGFFYAGTRSIIATSWSVDDLTTSHLMQVFYDQLKSTNKAEALRQAKISIRTHLRSNHPVYWSPYLLYGMVD